MTPILQVRGISKAFTGTRVLDDVSFDVNTAEVHALAGENGAGKSTLVKILAGIHSPDAGEIVFKGQPVRLRSPHDALRLGISMIHQELMPFLDLSVAENVCMGRAPVSRFGWLDKSAMNREARQLLERLGAPIHPTRRMRDLSVAEMQTVEIAKALGYRSELIVMDEPTSAISDKEVAALLALMADLKKRGTTIIYISHRMQEIFSATDAVTVLRDGRHIATLPTASLNENRLISLMVGRELTAAPTRKPPQPGDTALEVRGLTKRGRFHDINFSVRQGEILGIAGLMGAGRTDVVSAIFGLKPADSGEIQVQGQNVRITNPGQAMRSGIALVTEDRKAYGIIPEMPVSVNITLGSLRSLCRGPFISHVREDATAREQIRRLDIRTSGPGQKIKHLSGGNQQKAVIAKSLLAGPTVFMLDEPSRGIDVCAKAEVRNIMAALAAEGKAIILVSSEMPELLAWSDRIIVMREGSISAELLPHATNSEEILRYAMPQ